MFKRKKKQVTEQTPGRRTPQQSGPPVFSYYARGGSNSGQNVGRRDEVESGKPKLGRLRLLKGLPAYVVLIACAALVVFSLWIQPDPHIVVLAEPGTIFQPASAYQEAISRVWGERFGDQFKPSVNGDALERSIQAAVPDASSVQVQLPLLGRKPTVVIHPGKPALELIAHNGAFYVDASGKVMARSESVKQNQLQSVPTVQDQSDTKTEVGKAVLTADEATYIHDLYRQLQAEGLTVQSMVLPAQSVNEVDVTLNGQGYYIKFPTTGNARQGAGTYIALKSKLEADHTTPGEYVDLRIDEKAFIK